MSCNEWDEFKVGDLCDISSSKRIYSKEYVEAGIPFYRSKEIIKKYNNQDLDDVLYISEERFKEIDEKFGSPVKGDMLLTSVGTLGVPYIVQDGEKFYFKDGNLTWFKNFSDQLNSKFLYYWIQSPFGKEELSKITIGSTQQALTIESLKKMKIKLPERKEQNLIVEILSILDEKIEVNNQINKTLEKMAQTIFEHWFVDFQFPNENGEPYKSSDGEMVESELGMIPKGWEVKKLGELGEFKNGINYRRAENGDTEFNIINVRDLISEDFVLKKNLDKININKKKANQYLLEKGDLLIVRSASPGEIGIITKNEANIIYSGFIIRFRLYYKFQYIYMYFSLKDIKEKLKSFSNGTTLKNINQQILKDIKVIIPTKNIIEKFNEIITSIINEIVVLNKETEKIKEIRDTLLPKLMSGEIRVPIDN